MGKLDKRNFPMLGNDVPAIRTDAGAPVPAMICVDGHLVRAMADADGMLTICHTDAKKYRSSGEFSQLNNWKYLRPAASVPAQAAEAYTVFGALSLIEAAGACWLFWRSNDRVCRAMKLKVGDTLGVQTATVSLQGRPDPTSNLAAFPIPGGSRLSGRIGVASLVQYNASDRTELATLVLDPDAFKPGGVWTAEDHSEGYHHLLAQEPMDSLGYTFLSAGHIDQGTELAADGILRRHATLLVCCASEQPGRPNLSFGVPLLSSVDAQVQVQERGAPWQVDASPVELPQEFLDGSLATTCNAPDGSLRASCMSPQGLVRSATLVPNRCQPGDSNHGKPGLYAPAWILATVDTDGNTPRTDTQAPPAVAYLPLPVRRTRSPVEIPEPDGNGSRIHEDCRVSSFVEILATGLQGQPMLSTFYWGDLFMVPGYTFADITDEARSTMIVNLVADSFPYPVPDKRVWGADSPSGMVNWLLCGYDYLVSSERSKTLETTITTSGGSKFSTDLVILGWGGRVESSATAGYDSIFQSESIARTANSYSVTTKGLPLAFTDIPPQGDDAELYISREGAAFGSTPFTRVAFDLLASRPRASRSISEPVLMHGRPILETPPTSVSADYKSYSYDPGDLESYQEQRINERMRELFLALDPDAKADFRFNGEDFSNCYTQGNYLERIVKRFGSNCFGPQRNHPYLEFSFSETSITRSEYQETTGFTDMGGWFFNASFYAGLLSESDASASVGLLGLFDVGTTTMRASMSLLFGGDISTSSRSGTSENESWGVSLGEYLNPLAQGEAYTVRMYFLKSNPLWVRELKHFGFPSETYPSLPKMDLSNSAPVRILFTVPYISAPLRARLAQGRS